MSKKNGESRGPIAMFDGSLSIATGASREETNWKNKEVLWGKFVEKLSKTTFTHETQAEYEKATKARRDEIKDVGGFVAGVLANGRRKAGNVLERSMLTLDADFSKGGLWDTFTLTYSCAACIYSTHSHTPEKPRLRLIIPLKEPVSRDEYEAIARSVAGAIGIDDFDDTTFEPSRLMYWPSTSKGAEYLFEWQDGPWLDPDEVLGEYKDWRDSSQWPVSSRVSHVITREMKKQEDPTEKPGVIGAFCRAYSISEAIETFLQDYYDPVDNAEDRYSYKRGSTAAGLVIYENKYAYSHHGTDPTGGKLCNAFDLVRVHLFGLHDEDAKAGTPTNRLPSTTKMNNLAASDGKVKVQLHRDRLESAKNDFGDVELEEAEYGDWVAELEHEKTGKIKNTTPNVQQIIEYDKKLSEAGFSYNNFRHTKDVRGKTPWYKSDTERGIFSDADMSHLSLYLEKIYGITSDRCIRIALDVCFSKNSYNPIRDYLTGLEWDGRERLDTLLVRYLGVEDTPLNRAITRKTFVAAIKRVQEPGCKFDYTLVLVGDQGTKKSTLLFKMAKREWFSDNFRLYGDKRDLEQLLGAWIIEVQELSGFHGRNADMIKSFISTRLDAARMAYQREKGYFPRQCIFIGTTNNVDFLSDTTGNRRFWPVRVGVTLDKAGIADAVDNDLTDDVVDQVWAEAYHQYKRGEKLYLPPELEAEAARIQEQHRESDEWENVIERWLETPSTDTPFADDSELVKPDKVCVADIWGRCLAGKPDKLDSNSAKRIRNVMRRIPGWKEKPVKIDGRTVRGFQREEGYK